MWSIGLNHMTMAKASTSTLLDVAQALNCVGVELRNDVAHPLFDGLTASQMRAQSQARGLRILAIAEVYGFNDATPRALEQAEALARKASDAGAEAVVLIPFVAQAPVDRTTQRAHLGAAMTALRPVLERHNMVGLIEPLGFANASLRYKADVAEAWAEMGQPRCFGMIHDTFHHTLAGAPEVFAEMTRIVHVSGLRRAGEPLTLVDADRGLVDAQDRLETLDQMAKLQAAGFDGPFTIEAFAPDIHALIDPKAALSASIAFMNDQGANLAA